MRAMILGAGIGSRLDPLTRSLPKPLVPVVGKPVIGHIIDHLRESGISEIIINVQYLGHKMVSQLGDGSAYGVKLHYSHEDQLWGDAGGLKRCEAFFREDPDDTLLVVGGDDLSDIDIVRIISDHKDKGAKASIGVTPVEDPSAFGICVIDDTGRITRFQEKPKKGEAFSNLANTGIYVFSKKVFDYIPEETFFGFGKDVLPAMLAAGEIILAVPSDAYWQDVGNLTIYRQAQRDAIDKNVHVQFPHGATVKDTVVICQGATVEGEVSDYSVIGAHAVVEAGAVVKNSVLWDGAVVKSGTYLENCVVGSDVTVACSHGIFNGLLVEPTRPA